MRCLSLDRVIVGSGPVVEALTTEIDEVFGARTSSLWGMSEFGPAVLTPGDAPPSLPPTSNGNAIAGVEIRIVGQARHAALHPVGRLEVRGASRALGYFGQQDQFDAAIDSDGWFDTGDVARDLGDDGIRVLGRAADVIWICENIVPTVEIEASIQLLDGVDEASVIPSVDSRGEKTRLCAVLARSDTHALDTDLSVDAVRARLIADGFPAQDAGRRDCRRPVPHVRRCAGIYSPDIPNRRRAISASVGCRDVAGPTSSRAVGAWPGRPVAR